jgi:hypothetical protein
LHLTPRDELGACLKTLPGRPWGKTRSTLAWSEGKAMEVDQAGAAENDGALGVLEGANPSGSGAFV